MLSLVAVEVPDILAAVAVLAGLFKPLRKPWLLALPIPSLLERGEQGALEQQVVLTEATLYFLVQLRLAAAVEEETSSMVPLAAQAVALGMMRLEALQQADKAAQVVMAGLLLSMAAVAAAVLERLAQSGKLLELVMVALVFHHL